MHKYEIIKDIGGGTFGNVYEGINRETNERVAIKKLKRKINSWDDCMNQNEVYFLRKLNHPNIIKLIEVIREQNSDISLVFEYCDYNLYELIKNHRQQRNRIPEEQIKNIIYNITLGLSYLHSQNVMHRDLKPENVLIINNNTNNIIIKIADFGTSRQITTYNPKPLTDYICTRWYRSPECVLKSKHYDEKVDIWALGCIMAELYTLKPLFPGKSEFDQIDSIAKILGTPAYQEWPEGYQLMEILNMHFPEYNKKNLRDIIFDISDDGIDFLEYIFQYDPKKRPSADELLNHPYLKNNRLNSYNNDNIQNNFYSFKKNDSNILPYSQYNNNIFEEKNDYNNKFMSPIGIFPQIKNSSRSNLIYNDENNFYNKKSSYRSSSSMYDKHNYLNKNLSDKNFEYSKISNFNNNNILLNKSNVFEQKNNYENKYNYIPYKNEYGATANNAFSSIAKNDIVQNTPFIFNRFFNRQKNEVNDYRFHNIKPKLRKITDNIYGIFNNNYNDNQENYRSYFAQRYNLLPFSISICDKIYKN